MTDEKAVAESLNSPALYAAFDRYPSSKGAPVHIHEFADELFGFLGGGLLHVIGGDDLPRYQRELREDGSTVEILRFSEEIPNLLDRVASYGNQLVAAAEPHRESLRIVHVRDPWSAAPLFRAGLAGKSDRTARGSSGKSRPACLVYEANGFPSIELRYA